MNLMNFLAGLALATALPMAAQANTIYDNPGNPGAGGDCSFNTTCAAVAGRGDDFAAQQFTLDAGATVQSASFSIYAYDPAGTAANWAFYLDADGGPGALISSGSSAIADNVTRPDGLVQSFFNLPSVSLGAGSYYFAVQSVTASFSNYLANGVAESGAAETHDGGASWSPGYEGQSSVAVALYDNRVGAAGVPEPMSWALMLVGFGGMGAVLRRARQQTAVAATA
jgi:hypothetical protein